MADPLNIAQPANTDFVKFGADELRTLKTLLTGAYAGFITAPNNIGFKLKESGGTARDVVKMTAANVIEIGNAANALSLLGTAFTFTGATLDAGTLDGIDSTGFARLAAVSNFTTAPTISGNVVWHAGNDGVGSGLDADLLDGLSSAYFLSATNLNAGTIADARLPASLAGKTFTSSITLDTAAGTNAVISEVGLDKNSAVLEVFDFTNSGAGDAELRVNGNAVVTIAGPALNYVSLSDQGANPATPANAIVLFNKPTLPSGTIPWMIDENGRATPLQSHLGRNRIARIVPILGGSFSVINATNSQDVLDWTGIKMLAIGDTANANSKAQQASNAGAFYNAFNRSIVQISAAANQNAGFSTTTNNESLLRGAATARNGFYFSMIVGLEDCAASSGELKIFAGVSFNGAPFLNTGEPNGAYDIIGLAANSTYTNFRIMHNDQTGAATEIDLGVNFPCKTAAADVYLLELYSWEGGSIQYYVERLNTGDKASGSLAANLPLAASLLGPTIQIRNGAAAALNRIAFSRIYAETLNG